MYHCFGQKKFFQKSVVIALVLLLMMSVFGLDVFAQTEQAAENIAKKCDISVTQAIKTGHLRDGVLYNEVIIDRQGPQSVTFDLNGCEASCVYIKWGRCAAQWTLEAILADGTVATSEHGLLGIFQEYVELPEGTVSFSIITQDGKSNPLRFVEIEVYSAGELPENVHVWEPTPSTAEIMYISTHQDDELLFFGGAIPYYSGELDYDSVVAYTAYSNAMRLHEALEGLWTCGLTQHPIFLGNPDKYCRDISAARTFWDEDKVIAQIAGLYVKYRPQVVISQDANGEYGHGQHILTVHCVQQALEKAADEDYVSENFSGRTPWSVKKCYLHLYEENNISLPWDTIVMESAGGKTALEVAREAYLCHESQLQHTGNSVSTDNRDCRSFGLYWSSVGADVQKNDFFENLELRYNHLEPEIAVDYLERVGSTGWLYRRTDGEYEVSEFLRYCEVNGASGWYAADNTGSLIEPAMQIIPAKDDISLDMTQYETLSVVVGAVPMYCYNDGQNVFDLIVRYCTPAGAQESGFYAANSDGSLVTPLTNVEVSATLPQQEEIVQTETEPHGEPNLRKNDMKLIIIGSLHLFIIVVAIVIAVYHRIKCRGK